MIKEEHIRKYYLSDELSSGIRPEKLQDLRPMSDMTEEEAIELTRFVACADEFTDVQIRRDHFNDIIVTWGKCPDNFYCATGEIVWTAEQFHYLLKQRFDVFGILNK